jgi:hypothetical protein
MILIIKRVSIEAPITLTTLLHPPHPTVAPGFA